VVVQRSSTRAAAASAPHSPPCLFPTMRRSSGRYATKRPLLTRWDVILVTIVAAGVATPLLALTRKPSGWMLLVDPVVSALLGLLIAAVVAAMVRFFERGPQAK
jgi:O-antigen/teichoic acid export membrane protein